MREFVFQRLPLTSETSEARMATSLIESNDRSQVVGRAELPDNTTFHASLGDLGFAGFAGAGGEVAGVVCTGARAGIGGAGD